MNVFALPDFQFIGKLGKKGAGPTELNAPRGLCFTDAGTLLIADYGNDCVRHWTMDGSWIASYPVDKPWCIAAHGDTIVVGCCGTGVHMLSLKSEAVVRKWLTLGGGYISAIAFVNATTFAVSCYHGYPINLYTLEGVMKAPIAIRSHGLAVCANGYLLALDYCQKRVRVFSPTGDELSTAPFSAYSFQGRPLSIALHAEHAYVYLQDDDFDEDYGKLTRICVFE